MSPGVMVRLACLAVAALALVGTGHAVKAGQGRRRTTERTAVVPATESHLYCIVGAGPGGLQVAHHLERAGRDFVVLEKAPRVGASFEVYPRHRTLISINKRATMRGEADFNFRHDWHSLISDNETLMFPNYSHDFYPHADDYVRYLHDYAEYLGLTPHIRFGFEVHTVRRLSEAERGATAHMSESADGHQPITYRYFRLAEAGADGNAEGGAEAGAAGARSVDCTRVLWAAGYGMEAVAQFRRPEDNALVSTYGTHDLNASAYFNRSVAIFGMGNSAFETANHLMPQAGHVAVLSRRGHPKWAWETHYVGDLRAINDLFIDNYQLKATDNLGAVDTNRTMLTKADWLNIGRDQLCLDSPELAEFREAIELGAVQEGDYDKFNGSNTMLDTLRALPKSCYDHIIMCTGFKLDPTPFERGGMSIATVANGKLPQLNPDYESVSEPGVYFVGALAHGYDYRKSSGGFVHGLRYTARAAWRTLEVQFHGKQPAPYMDWPGVKRLRADTLNLTRHLIHRVNTASGPYQMFGQKGLFDVVVLPQHWCAPHHAADPEPDSAEAAAWAAYEETYEAEREAAEAETAWYLEDVPRGVAAALTTPEDCVVMWNFEYGPDFHGHSTVFNNNRVGHTFDPSTAHLSKFLHPVLYAMPPTGEGSDGGYAARMGSEDLERPTYTMHLVSDSLTKFDTLPNHKRPTLELFVQLRNRGRVEQPRRPEDARINEKVNTPFPSGLGMWAHRHLSQEEIQRRIAERDRRLEVEAQGSMG